MKTRYPVTLSVCIVILQLCATSAMAQLPTQRWSDKYGGSMVEVPFAIKTTADGGSIVAGYTTSKDGQVHNTTPNEYWDLWVVKLDKCGNLQWEKTLGGSGYETARDIIEHNNGYLVVGETNSIDGDVIAGYGATKDIWLLQLSAAGQLLWQKRIGGSGLDIGNRLLAMDNNNIFIVASTSSNDGNFSGNHGTGGYTDGGLIKIDGSGNIIWSKCYGGTKNDELTDIQISGSRIFLSGYANSTDGDIPPNQKNYDVWFLCADANGNRIFSNIFGGEQNDVSYSMTKGLDGSFTLAGYTTSSNGDVTEAKGSQDFWILNISANGKLNWQKTLGGSDAEYASCILTDTDGGYLVGGISYSSDGDVNAARGEGDYWLVKLNANGSLLWKENFGGRENDYLRAISIRPETFEYILAGDSEYIFGDAEPGYGETDFYVLNFKPVDTLTRDTIVCAVNNFSLAPVLMQDACGNDSALITYRPVAVELPFANNLTSDTIFVGQQSILPLSTQGPITWSAHHTLSCTQCSEPIAKPVITTRYTATIQLQGCSVSDDFTVVVLEDALVRLPNAFTPNGDGVNDVFGPAGKVPDHYLMQIYNRNGELVFRSSSMNSRWDGRHKGVMQDNGVFVYMIRYNNMEQQIEMKKGTVVLIR